MSHSTKPETVIEGGPESAQFTPAARQALNWWTNKMPEGGYQAFAAEMERAASEIMERYGFDDEIMGQFQVGKVFEFKRT